MGNTQIEIVFDIDSLISQVKDAIYNFFPYDFIPKLLLATMALVFVFGIYRLYEINKSEENAED